MGNHRRLVWTKWEQPVIILTKQTSIKCVSRARVHTHTPTHTNVNACTSTNKVTLKVHMSLLLSTNMPAWTRTEPPPPTPPPTHTHTLHHQFGPGKRDREVVRDLISSESQVTVWKAGDPANAQHRPRAVEIYRYKNMGLPFQAKISQVVMFPQVSLRRFVEQFMMTGCGLHDSYQRLSLWLLFGIMNKHRPKHFWFVSWHDSIRVKPSETRSGRTRNIRGGRYPWNSRYTGGNPKTNFTTYITRLS